MPNVTVEGEKSFEVQPGTKLVLAIEDAGIDIMHRCGGNARCTTCRVQVVHGDLPEMGDAERDRLAREGDLGPDIRLSCQIRVENDLTLRVLNRASAQGVTPGPRPED
jgi:ferredoxin